MVTRSSYGALKDSGLFCGISTLVRLRFAYLPSVFRLYKTIHWARLGYFMSSGTLSHFGLLRAQGHALDLDWVSSRLQHAV